MSDVLVRALASTDADFLENLLTDSRIRQYLGGPLNVEQAKHRAHQWLQSQDGQNWIILFQGLSVGLISLGKHVDSQLPELSFQLLSEFQGKNIAFDACRQVLLGVKDTVVAETQVKNSKAQTLLKRLGFQSQKTLERFGEIQRYFVRQADFSLFATDAIANNRPHAKKEAE